MVSSQELVVPCSSVFLLEGFVANVRSGVVYAMASQIDGLAKNSNNQGVVANVRSGVVYVMASQIDGLAKNSNKQSIGPRNDDSKKIEHLFA